MKTLIIIVLIGIICAVGFNVLSSGIKTIEKYNESQANQIEQILDMERGMK